MDVHEFSKILHEGFKEYPPGKCQYAASSDMIREIFPEKSSLGKAIELLAFAREGKVAPPQSTDEQLKRFCEANGYEYYYVPEMNDIYIFRKRVSEEDLLPRPPQRKLIQKFDGRGEPLPYVELEYIDE